MTSRSVRRALASGMAGVLPLLAAIACGGEGRGSAASGSAAGVSDGPGGPPVSAPAAASGTTESPGRARRLAAVEIEATEEDWRIVRETLRRAESDRLDTLSVGDAVAAMGLYFVGTPYEPSTLEVPGPERLVINLRALDCVTFVETALALVHTLRADGAVGDWSEEELRRRYAGSLQNLRYRGGRLEGYPSRLHYFSEWMKDAEGKGILRMVTPDLGGVVDPEPIDFMSTHRDAYRQLGDPSVLDQIRRIEEGLGEIPRYVLPEERIAEEAAGIRSGDIVAATSTVRGLDVAHTGIALWRDGALHLLHAPLVGDSVHVSPRTLARRIQQIGGQDGIMVARPVER